MASTPSSYNIFLLIYSINYQNYKSDLENGDIWGLVNGEWGLVEAIFQFTLLSFSKCSYAFL